MRATREVGGNGGRGDERKPVGDMSKDKEKGQAGLHLCRLKWKERGGKAGKEEETNIDFILVTGLESYILGEE